MNRRTLIACAAIAPLAAVPFAGTPVAADPLIQYWADRQRLMKAWNEAIELSGDWETPECEALERGWSGAEKKLCSTPATTIEGLVAQLEYTSSEFGDTLRNGWSDPYSRMFDTLLAGAKGLVA